MTTEMDVSYRDEVEFLKVVTMGDGGVGKSCLVLRVVQDEFVEEYDPNIEDTFRKQMIVDRKPVLVEIWDTAGQEEYKFLMDMWIREGDGFVLVYDITSQHSFDRLEMILEKIVRVLDKETFPCVIAGNKCDLEKHRVISKEKGQELADKWNAVFVETSAKTNLNTVGAFGDCVKEIRKAKAPKKKVKPGRTGLKCAIL
eukprot:UN30644